MKRKCFCSCSEYTARTEALKLVFKTIFYEFTQCLHYVILRESEKGTTFTPFYFCTQEDSKLYKCVTTSPHSTRNFQFACLSTSRSCCRVGRGLAVNPTDWDSYIPDMSLWIPASFLVIQTLGGQEVMTTVVVSSCLHGRPGLTHWFPAAALAIASMEQYDASPHHSPSLSNKFRI